MRKEERGKREESRSFLLVKLEDTSAEYSKCASTLLFVNLTLYREAKT